MTWCIFLKKFVFNDDKCLCSYNIWSQQLKHVNFSLWMFRHSKPNNSNIWLNIKRAHVYFTQGPRFLCHFTVRGFKPKFMLHKHRTCIQIIKFRGSNIKWNPYIQLLETEHFTELFAVTGLPPAAAEPHCPPLSLLQHLWWFWRFFNKVKSYLKKKNEQ